MLGLFRSSPKPPLPDEAKLRYFENQFHWLLENFGEGPLHKKTRVPDKIDFPITFDGTEKSVKQLLAILCRQMDLNPDEIHIDYYTEGKRSLDAGASRVFLQGTKQTGGLYWGRAEDNKYHIWLRRDHLKMPEELTATLAHELAHVLLLGQGKLHREYDRDHELLTEMLCVFYGLGIFRANAAFRFNKGFEGWSWQSAGYLSQQSWGYVLALHAFIRNEENPGWAKFLTANLQKDLARSIHWLSKTAAGEAFLSSRWKNDFYGMEKKNFSGKWIKQSVYGPHYGKENEGQSMLSELDISDDEGRLSGTGKDTEGHMIQSAPITINGTIRNTAIHFELWYHFHDKVSEDGIVLRKAEQEPYAVTYDGYYSPFLDVFIGEWKIMREIPGQGIVSMGSGTWEMKRAGS